MVGFVADRLRRLGLVACFTIIGAVVGGILVVVLAWQIDARLTRLVLDQVAARAIDQVQLGVLRQVTIQDFEPPYTREKLDDLAARLGPMVWQVRADGAGVIRLHLFARDGTVLYSDLASKRGQVVQPAQVPLLARALAGELGTNVSSLGSPENADLRARYDGALEVYVPFRLRGQVVAAYEIYQDLAPIRPIRPLVWSMVAGGFLVLFLSLLTVVHRATGIIQRQQFERERLVQQAAEAEALRELDRLKDELMSVVSHELRTPLSSIVGFAELLATRPFPEDQRRQFFDLIHREGLRLTDLINDFLDLQRIESGREEIAPQPTELQALIQGAVEAAGEDPKHPLVLEVPDRLPKIRADAERIRQVIDNLVSNARKYSPAGGEVRVSARRVNGMVEVAVIDQGLGLPPEALPRLFEKFYRVDAPDRRAIPGTGLGLAICRRIVEAHGGRIWAESAGPGKGARFLFTLPIVQTAEATRVG